MNKEQLIEFVQWLPTKVKAFKNKSPEEIVNALNTLSKTPEGQKQIEGLITAFKQESAAITPEEGSGMFKKGGKIDYLVEKFQQGGRSQRHSDVGRTTFHGVDLFEYGPNSYKTSKGDLARTLQSGTAMKTLPNGVGVRQITNNNITTTELVSPNKQDTLYIHNGVGGRVDSNIDDSGILGVLGLKKSTPVSGRYKSLQSKFNTQKFDEGGKTEDSKINILDLVSSVSENNLNKHKENLVDRVNRSGANFVGRLQDSNRRTIPDWENPDNITSHKLGYVTDDQGAIVYPEVSAGFNGQLTDFTDPKVIRNYGGQNPGLDVAISNRDTVRMTPGNAE